MYFNFNENLFFFRSPEALQAAADYDGLATRDPPVNLRRDHWICVLHSSSHQSVVVSVSHFC